MNKRDSVTSGPAHDMREGDSPRRRQAAPAHQSEAKPMSPQAHKAFLAKAAAAAAAPAVVTAGQRAYLTYFEARGGVNTQGGAMPVWSDLPADIRQYWERAGVEPAGAPPWWANKVFWFNALVLVLAYAEANAGTLKDYLPGSIYAYVAFGLPVANKLIRLIQLFRARP